MPRAAAALALATSLLGLSGCATEKVYISKNLGTLQKMAILPMANETTDLDGPLFIRKLLFDQLAGRGGDLLPIAQIDEKLKAEGFTDGGQLGAATPQKLGEWLGAETLFYSVLEEFNYINVGFYWQRRVKILGRLVDAKSGEKLWEAERSWSTQQLVADKKQAKEQFAIQLAAKALEKMTHVPLQAESRIAVDRLLNTLPKRP